jgi:hypothetical protein
LDGHEMVQRSLKTQIKFPHRATSEFAADLRDIKLRLGILQVHPLQCLDDDA